MLVDGLFEETVQLKTLPEFQSQPRGAELARPLQTHLVQQHPRYLRIIRRRLHLRREQLELLRLALIVEDFYRLQPACLRRAVQFPEIAQCSLPRAVGRTHRFHQRPVRVVFSILVAAVRAQKHYRPILSRDRIPFKRVGLHYIGFRDPFVANKATYLLAKPENC
jgi:hypothetical protein